MTEPRATIRDLARRAGVAVGTASRAMSGAGAVSVETASRVHAAARDLGYRPSAAGRALRRGSSQAVGVMVPTTANPIFAQSLEGIEAEARAAGLSVVMVASGYDGARELDAMAALAARDVDGMILTLVDTSPARLAAVAAHGFPHVLLYNRSQGPESGGPGLVTVDSRAAVAEATTHLVALGHRRIAFLGGDFAASDRSRARHDGYGDAMRAAGLPLWPATLLPFDAGAAAYDAALSGLLRRLAPPTALICSNDLLGLHAIAAARRLGIDVPGELSVIGFDGMEAARLVSPTLATVLQPAREMGAAAMAMLVAMIGGAAARHVTMPHTFLPGESLAPPRQAPIRTGGAVPDLPPAEGRSP